MAKHKFLIALMRNEQQVGVECVRCGMKVFGPLSPQVAEQDCKKLDSSQNALRVVREATEGK